MNASSLTRSLVLVALLSLVAIVMSTGVAVADTRLAALEPMPSVDGRSVEEPYSAGLALAIPVLATGVSAGLLTIAGSEDDDTYFALGLVGLAIGPSLGHAYTRDWQSFAISTGMRVGGAGVLAAAVGMSLGDSSAPAGLLGVVGGISIVGGTLYGLVDAPFSAMRQNEKRGKWSLTPAPMKGPNQSTGWGAQMQMSF